VPPFKYRLGAEVTEQHGHRCFLRWVPLPDTQQTIENLEKL